jgi:hypothetical protein
VVNRSARELSTARARLRLRCAAALWLSSATLAGQSVLTVGTRPGPGVDFTSVQAAVDAAGHGDVLLLLPGDHVGPATVDKGLVLFGVAASDGTAPSLSELTIDTPSASAHVVVRGIRLSSPSPSSDEDRNALRVVGSPGLAWIENSLASAAPGQDARVEGSGGVLFIRCAFTGDKGLDGGVLGSASDPGPAFFSVFTSQALFECSVVGGPGAAAKQSGFFTTQAQNGGFGAILAPASGKWTLASRVAIVGGMGGDGVLTSAGQCVPPGNGGTSLYVASLLHSDALDLVGGPSGSPEAGCPASGEGDQLEVAGVGTIASLPVELPSLHVPPLLEPGQVVQLHYEGQPGQPVLLLVAAAPGLLWMPGGQGALAVALDHRVTSLGAADSAGVIDLSVPIPADVLAGAGNGAALVLFLQAVSVAPDGLALSNPTVVAILDVP